MLTRKLHPEFQHHVKNPSNFILDLDELLTFSHLWFGIDHFPFCVSGRRLKDIEWPKNHSNSDMVLESYTPFRNDVERQRPHNLQCSIKRTEPSLHSKTMGRHWYAKKCFEKSFHLLGKQICVFILTFERNYYLNILLNEIEWVTK